MFINNFVSVAQNLVDKGAVKYSDGTMLQISAYTPSCNENALGSVEISGIPPNMTEDTLIMFLENTRRSGGGKVAEMQFDKHKRMALVDFEDQKGKNVLYKLFFGFRFIEVTISYVHFYFEKKDPAIF